MESFPFHVGREMLGICLAGHDSIISLLAVTEIRQALLFLWNKLELLSDKFGSQRGKTRASRLRLHQLRTTALKYKLLVENSIVCRHPGDGGRDGDFQIKGLSTSEVQQGFPSNTCARARQPLAFTLGWMKTFRVEGEVGPVSEWSALWSVIGSETADAADEPDSSWRARANVERVQKKYNDEPHLQDKDVKHAELTKKRRTLMKKRIHAAVN